MSLMPRTSKELEKAAKYNLGGYRHAVCEDKSFEVFWRDEGMLCELHLCTWLPKKSPIRILSSNMFQKSDISFQRVFWNKKIAPVSSGHLNDTHSES